MLPRIYRFASAQTVTFDDPNLVIQTGSLERAAFQFWSANYDPRRLAGLDFRFRLFRKRGTRL